MAPRSKEQRVTEPRAPLVSVIVPVFNDAEGIERCLRALENQSYSKRSYEVIVVDNGSDESIEPVVAAFGQARASHEARSGSYAARNKGIELAKGQIVAFTDADCIPAADWIELGVAALAQMPQFQLVAGRVEIFARDASHPTAVELYEMRSALLQQEYVEVGGFAATANLFTHKAVIERVGPFDAELRSGGDAEWSRRARSAGYRLTYVDDIRVAHPARRSIGQLYRKVTRIIGGLHDLRCRNVTGLHPRLGKGFIVDALPPVRASLEVLRDPAIRRRRDRLKVVLVMVFVQYVQVWETLRLRLGGRSKR